MKIGEYGVNNLNTSSVAKKYTIKCLKKTIMEMMRDRGYAIPFEKKLENSKIQLDTPILVACNDVEECYIFFCMEPKLGVQEFRKFQIILEEYNIHHCIIISNLGATSFTSTMLQNIDSSELEIELFPYKYLIKNPTLHCLYKSHRALSNDEKEKILMKYHANDEKMPILFKDDRICQYFNFPIGTVVEITRCYGSVGPYKNYRIVQKCG